MSRLAAGSRPVALVTGVSRRIGIGAAIAEALAEDGFDVALTCWTAYDARMEWGSRPGDLADIESRLGSHGAATVTLEADLVDVATPAAVFDAVEAGLGPVDVLVLNHAESVDSDLLTTTVESFDRHYAVNVRASWLLIREYAERCARTGPAASSRRRIIALTSDHTAGNVPYGATKGALERIVVAAARELGHLRITANAVNPGATDTGWMSDQLLRDTAAEVPLGRVGTPADAAALVSFLCSERGAWVNGQVLHSDGGRHS
jgi:3-oxoacyl-[acyl-carrier protein] reductase